jgi:luciferase family oxidoreductase group 1
MMIAVSVLDLAPVPQGHTPGDALRNARDLARHAERWGFQRYWLAEHHNMTGIASAATAQFGTLESLYPGRIDLGLGRAPGTDPMTWRALRRDPGAADQFPRDVMELQALFADPRPGQLLRAVPGAGLHVPLWILGSSLFGAQLAAALGLPYAFASHFAPEQLLPALEVYRARFQPSAQLAKPHAMAGINVIAAETDAAAKRLFTSPQQAFTNIFRGTRGLLPPPIDDIETYWTPSEKPQASRMLTYSVVGAKDTVRDGLARFIAETQVDELMVVAAIHDHAARLRSYEIVGEIVGEIAAG